MARSSREDAARVSVCSSLVSIGADVVETTSPVATQTARFLVSASFEPISLFTRRDFPAPRFRVRFFVDMRRSPCSSLRALEREHRAIVEANALRALLKGTQRVRLSSSSNVKPCAVRLSTGLSISALWTPHTRARDALSFQLLGPRRGAARVVVEPGQHGRRVNLISAGPYAARAARSICDINKR
jgi:hypothetical protein